MTHKTRKNQSRRGSQAVQRGGLQQNTLDMFFNKDKIEKALSVETCTSYITQGQYGSILKACTSIAGECRPPCFTIKYVPSEEMNSETKMRNEVLAHECHILYDITNAGIKINSNEISSHIEQYIGSIVPQRTTPWMFAENIVGTTLLSGGIPKDGRHEAVSCYFQVLLVLDDIQRALPGFVHGDLNPGNIFLLRRPLKHKECRFENVSYTEDGDAIINSYRFTTNYTVKLIDFGFSEHENYKWGVYHPAQPGRDLIGLWQLDAYMALNSFYSVAKDKQKQQFKEICSSFFGDMLTETLDLPDFDIYVNLSMLDEFQSKKHELFTLLDSLRV